jgi:TonB family protein
MIGLPLLAIAGVATWHFGLRGASDGGTAPAPTPASNASGAATPSEATVPGGAKVEVQLEANVANARVSFRRHLEAAPLKTDLAPSDMVELVEVSAPGYKTERYWLTFDRPTHLVAHLSRGDGLEEATEEQTLVALGEAAAPQQPAATVRRASAVSAQPRKIGHGAAEVSPPPSGAVEPPAQALERPAEPAVPVPPAGSEPSTAGPAAAHDAPATPALAPAKAEDARAIAPATLKALLVASSPIDVPELVKTQMQRDENKKASAVIKVCIGTEGAVTHASVMKSSGYPAYDNSLVTAVRGWRYRAYVVDGRAVPACSAVAVSSVVP